MNEKERDPKSVRSLSFSRTLAVCVFRPAIPQRSHPCVALSALPDEVVIIMSFPISGAKVLLFFDMTKF